MSDSEESPVAKRSKTAFDADDPKWVDDVDRFEEAARAEITKTYNQLVAAYKGRDVLPALDRKATSKMWETYYRYEKELLIEWGLKFAPSPEEKNKEEVGKGKADKKDDEDDDEDEEEEEEDEEDEEDEEEEDEEEEEEEEEEEDEEEEEHSESGEYLDAPDGLDADSEDEEAVVGSDSDNESEEASNEDD